MKRLGVIFFILSFAAFAADGPEVAYGKFHRAIAAADLEEAMKYAPAARRAELASMSTAQKDAQLKMLSMLMPRAFTLLSKNIAPNGQTAHLVLTGPGQPILSGARPETMYGQVKMVNEGGEWKVDETSWSNDKPALAAPVKQSAPAPAAAAKPADAKAATVVAPGPPVRKLGTAKQECVYKPVMTNEDLERCR